MATPDPNHFNGMQARLERDLINTQDHIENLWEVLMSYVNGEEFPDEHELASVITSLRVQKEQVAEFMKYMRLVAGMTLEFPNRTERREYLRANGL